ncbi:MAG TPA: hypothetical protein VLH86_02550 [Patescibacteria group bacterium]|nr:hypothetical protein [Patescibacteria group bacterium]
MAKTVTQRNVKDYFILGPTLQRDNGVLEAIYALYYLPPNYKLILPSAAPEDMSYQNEVLSVVNKNALSERVHFMKNSRSADSPEAYASAMLSFSRSAS